MYGRRETRLGKAGILATYISKVRCLVSLLFPSSLIFAFPQQTYCCDSVFIGTLIPWCFQPLPSHQNHFCHGPIRQALSLSVFFATAVAVTKDKALGKRNNKKSGKAKRPAKPPPPLRGRDTHATRSSARVTKKSSRALLNASSTPSSRSRVASAASSPNTSKAPERTVIIEDPADEDDEESSSASDDVVMEDSPEPTSLEKKAAMLRRELTASREMAAEQVVNYSEDPSFGSLARDFPVVTPRMMADIQHRKFNVKEIRPFKMFCQNVSHWLRSGINSLCSWRCRFIV